MSQSPQPPIDSLEGKLPKGSREGGEPRDKINLTSKSTTFVPDQPSRSDYLDFGPYVSALVDLVVSPNTQTPVTLGIFGTWGSGKTTLMQLMEQAAKELRAKTKSPALELLWMNVWQLSQHGEGWQAFLQALFTQVHKSLPFFKRARFDLRLMRDRIDKNALFRQLLVNSYRIVIVSAPFLLARFLPIGANPVTAAIRDPQIRNATTLLLGLWLLLKPVLEAAKEKVSLDLGAVLKDAPYEMQISALQQLQEHFERLVKASVGEDGRLVVFIDDLDRCSPDRIAEVLEALKLFATTPNCVYVLALDQDIVAQSIQAKYKDSAGVSRDGALINGARYLEKIVQLPFWLPIIEIDDIRGYVKSFNAAWPHQGCADIFTEGLPPNPRQVKRAINVFFLLWQLAEHRRRKLGATVTPLRLAKVVVLQTAYPDIFDILKGAPQLLKELETHCLKSPDEQDLADKNELLNPNLRDVVKRSGLQRLFELDRDDPLALFSGLEITDLATFFSLTRRVALPAVESPAIVEGSVGSEVIHGEKIVNIYHSDEPSISSLRQLPPPPRDFTGRERELSELIDSVEKEGGIPIIISGLGGIGKTALALKLAEQLTARYPDGQFYFDLRGGSPKSTGAIDAMAHVIRSLYPTAKLPDSEEELSALYRSVLHGQRALLLMDNATDALQVEPLIPPETCILLVTSRQQLTLPGSVSRNLDSLSPVDARALLLKIAPHLGGYASRMAELCGNLPLALRLAASALVQRIDLKPEDYVERLTVAKERLKLVDASISLSYESLTSDMQRLWCALSVFPGTFDTPAAAEMWKIDEPEAKDVLSSLVAYSLVEWNESSGRYGLNDLIRLFANDRLGDTQRSDSQLRHAEHYVAVMRAADELYRRGGQALEEGLELFNLEWSNIRAGQAWAEEYSTEKDEAAALCINYPNAGAHLLDLRQHPRERLRWLEAALVAARRLDRRDAEGPLLSNLGLAYAALGEISRALEFYERSLAIAREVGSRAGEGAALGNLGLAYASLGENQRAIDYFEQQLAISRDISDRAGEGAALGNLGLAYTDVGETKRAVEFFEKRLAIAREIGDRRSEGNVLSNLGSTYYVLGELRRALELHEQALVIAREIGDSRGQGKALYNASLVLDQLGERPKAIENARAALSLFAQIEDPNAARVQKQLDEWDMSTDSEGNDRH
jgi:tetratricopeptide (TPR) repeat protein